MAHVHEKIDFTVEVFAVYQNKILLRKHDKYGIWIGVGGHIELDEDPNEAAIREVREEVGLEIRLFSQTIVESVDKEYRELVPPAFLNRHRISNNHEHIALVYFAESLSDKVIAEKETDEWKWLTHHEVEENSIGMTPQIQRYARQALQKFSI